MEVIIYFWGVSQCFFKLCYDSGQPGVFNQLDVILQEFIAFHLNVVCVDDNTRYYNDQNAHLIKPFWFSCSISCPFYFLRLQRYTPITYSVSHP